MEYSGYSKEKLRDVIEKAVAAENRRQPRFYVVTGSHLYGFQSDSSDIDLRGFHTVPPERYAYLNSPKQEVTVNMDGITEGFEEHEIVDLRSYELRHFSEHIHGANYNAMELLFQAPRVMNGVSLEIDALKELVKEYLPMNVPHSYIGMAKSNYYNYLDPDKEEAYDPRPKKFLYVYRGLLGAQYVLDHEEIEADIRELGDSVDFGKPDLVSDLIEYKQTSEPDSVCSGELLDRSRREITKAFNSVDDPGNVDKSGFKEELDDWMGKTRGT